MYKEKQPLKYYYRVIKEKGVDRVGTIIKVDERHKQHFDDDEHFKCIGTWQDAYVGDMQEKLNEAFGEDLKERFIKNLRTGSNPYEHQVYIREIDTSLDMSIFEFIKRRIFTKFEIWKVKRQKDIEFKNFKKSNFITINSEEEFIQVLQDETGKLFNND